jgi:hypothetical protein
MTSTSMPMLPHKQDQVLTFQAQFVELFCECDPGERSGTFDSADEAIAAHERSFDAKNKG